MSQSIETFKHTIARELTFASRLSPCRYTNMYIGLLECKPQHIYFIDSPKGLPDYDQPIRPYKRNTPDLYLFKDISTMVICVIIWRSVKSGWHPWQNMQTVANLTSMQGMPFRLIEVVQIASCIFASLTDAHKLNIGMVDLKLETFLSTWWARRGWRTSGNFESYFVRRSFYLIVMHWKIMCNRGRWRNMRPGNSLGLLDQKCRGTR